jgi:hypothetical protein
MTHASLGAGFFGDLVQAIVGRSRYAAEKHFKTVYNSHRA